MRFGTTSLQHPPSVMNTGGLSTLAVGIASQTASWERVINGVAAYCTIGFKLKKMTLITSVLVCDIVLLENRNFHLFK